METDGQTRRRVLVTVAKREGWNGWWDLGRQWQEGETEAELTDEEIEKLGKRPGVLISDIASGRAIKTSVSGAAFSERVTVDERRVLEEFRRAKREDPGLAKRVSEEPRRPTGTSRAPKLEGMTPDTSDDKSQRPMDPPPATPPPNPFVSEASTAAVTSAASGGEKVVDQGKGSGDRHEKGSKR